MENRIPFTPEAVASVDPWEKRSSPTGESTELAIRKTDAPSGQTSALEDGAIICRASKGPPTEV